MFRDLRGGTGGLEFFADLGRFGGLRESDERVLVKDKSSFDVERREELSAVVIVEVLVLKSLLACSTFLFEFILIL
jgi:hypothetical protein